jgi:prophage DNA circulation protein
MRSLSSIETLSGQKWLRRTVTIVGVKYNMDDQVKDEVTAVAESTETTASGETPERFGLGIKKVDDAVYKIDAGVRKIDAGVRRISQEIHKVTDKKK